MSIITPLKQSVIFEPLWSALERFEGFDHLPMPNELNEKLRVEGIRFVAQDTRSSDFDDGYEPRIYLRGEVQTRENSWHDFFKGFDLALARYGESAVLPESLKKNSMFYA